LCSITDESAPKNEEVEWQRFCLSKETRGTKIKSSPEGNREKKTFRPRDKTNKNVAYLDERRPRRPSPRFFFVSFLFVALASLFELVHGGGEEFGGAVGAGFVVAV
jgi:hypothetical protein|tara:strand:- start:2257 stop:2574 length:318 start_codon:yes stop_codon:yes gene_type:complete